MQYQHSPIKGKLLAPHKTYLHLLFPDWPCYRETRALSMRFGGIVTLTDRVSFHQPGPDNATAPGGEMHRICQTSLTDIGLRSEIIERSPEPCTPYWCRHDTESVVSLAGISHYLSLLFHCDRLRIMLLLAGCTEWDSTG